MPLPSAADQVVIQGVLLDEVTGAGLAGTVTSQPVALAGQSAEPMVLAADSHAHIQTRPRTATPDPTTGYWAIMALSTNDPDLDAYGGRTITLPEQAPRTIEVPWNAPQVTVSTAMAAQINPGNVAGRPVAGDTVRAIWYHQAAGFVAPTPANAYLTSAQTIDLIASAIGSGGGGSGSGDLPEYSPSAQTAAVTASGLTGKTTRFNTTSAAIAQPLPPAVAGRQVAVGWDAGTNALTLTADGSDVIGSGSATSVPIPVINAVVQLHCTTAGRWRVVGGHLPSSYVVFNSANTDQTGAAPGRLPAVTQVNPTGYGLTAAPTADGQILIWNDTTKRWVPANTSTITPAAIGAQPASADLTTIAALNSTTAGVMVTDGGGWIRKTYAQLKTALGLTKSDVGLGNVDNTADTDKPVSTATAAAIAARGFGFPASIDTAELRGSDTQALPVNRAVWHRVRDGGTITKIAVHVAVQSGNISVGAYANSGSARAAVPGAPLSLSGAVACPPVGYAEIALAAAAAVKPGDWIAISSDNSTATFKSGLPGLSLSALGSGRTYYRDTAHPLPNAAPDSLTAITGYPIALVGVA